MDELISNLRNTESRSKRALLDEAADKLDALRAEIDRLRKENKAIVDDYMALMQDVRNLDSCEICGWHDSDGRCHRQHDLKNCFGWRGRERARFWDL